MILKKKKYYFKCQPKTANELYSQIYPKCLWSFQHFSLTLFLNTLMVVWTALLGDCGQRSSGQSAPLHPDTEAFVMISPGPDCLARRDKFLCSALNEFKCTYWVSKAITVQ